MSHLESSQVSCADIKHTVILHIWPSVHRNRAFPFFSSIAASNSTGFPDGSSFFFFSSFNLNTCIFAIFMLCLLLNNLYSNSHVIIMLWFYVFLPCFSLGISSWPWLNKLKLEGSLTMWQIVCNFSPSSMYYSPFPVVASFVQLSDKFSPEFLHGSYYGDDHPLFFSLILLLSLSSCSCYLSFQWSGVCTDLLSNVSSIATSHLPVMLSLLRNPVDTHLYE